jgi:hypothetical protein
MKVYESCNISDPIQIFLKVWRTLGSPAWPKAQNARDRETNFNRFTKGI